MKKYKLPYSKPNVLKELLTSYEPLFESEGSSLELDLMTNLILETDSFVYLKEKDSENLFTFIYLVETEEILIIPTSQNPQENKSLIETKLNMNGKEILVTDGNTLREFEDVREEVVNNIKDVTSEPVIFYKPFNPESFDFSKHIKVFANYDIEVFQTRQKTPRYFLIMKQPATKEELLNQKFIIPVYIDEVDGSAISLFALTQEGVVEQLVGDSIEDFNVNVLNRISETILNTQNLTQKKETPDTLGVNTTPDTDIATE